MLFFGWRFRFHGLRPALGAAALLLLALVLPVSPAGATGAAPVATAARIEEEGRFARLLVDLGAPAQGAAYVLAAPARVIIDLPEVNFQLPQGAGRAEPAKGQKSAPKIISSFRFGLFAPGKSRIVIDLGRPALVQKVLTAPNPDGGFQLQVELQETDPATFGVAARAAASEAVARDPVAEGPAAPRLRGTDANRPMIVIDPGHGGIDVGAQGKLNVVEKDIVFEFSQALRARLEATGRYRILMTRTSDVFVPLAKRVKVARDSGADLFISIHADTLTDTGGVSGATVYTVSDKASDQFAARLAEKENLADAAAGLEGADDANDVSDILFDLTRRETRAYSHNFARTLVNYWSEAGRLNKNPHRSAGFRVLKAPDVPSVLLELGYLSNEKDTAALMKPEWRMKAADATARAVDAFFEPRLGGAAGSGSPAHP